MGTGDPDQALSQYSNDGRGEKVILHPHVDQSGDGTGGIIRVKGAEDQMAGQGRLDGNFRCLRISNLADEDHIRVLPDNGSQGIGKGEPDGRLDLNLVDPSELIFYGILDGDDLLLRGVDLFESTVKGGGLSASCGTGDENDPMRSLDQVP